jgi:hypothetical protein
VTRRILDSRVGVRNAGADVVVRTEVLRLDLVQVLVVSRKGEPPEMLQRIHVAGLKI